MSESNLTTRRSHARRGRFLEGALFWLFRLATYFVLACATYIFLDIAIKGSRTVFTSKPPFVNVAFLTEPPQTLFVFDFEGQKMTLSDRQFRQWQAEHPEAAVEPQTVAYRLLGPTGLPLEGWWYSIKLHPEMFKGAGARGLLSIVKRLCD